MLYLVRIILFYELSVPTWCVPICSSIKSLDGVVQWMWLISDVLGRHCDFNLIHFDMNS